MVTIVEIPVAEPPRFTLEVSGLTVRNVAALVALDEARSENLLGLSFLSRLLRFEYGNGRMVLEQ